MLRAQTIGWKAALRELEGGIIGLGYKTRSNIAGSVPFVAKGGSSQGFPPSRLHHSVSIALECVLCSLLGLPVCNKLRYLAYSVTHAGWGRGEDSGTFDRFEGNR